MLGDADVVAAQAFPPFLSHPAIPAPATRSHRSPMTERTPDGPGSGRPPRPKNAAAYKSFFVEKRAVEALHGRCDGVPGHGPGARDGEALGSRVRPVTGRRDGTHERRRELLERVEAHTQGRVPSAVAEAPTSLLGYVRGPSEPARDGHAGVDSARRGGDDRTAADVPGTGVRQRAVGGGSLVSDTIPLRGVSFPAQSGCITQRFADQTRGGPMTAPGRPIFRNRTRLGRGQPPLAGDSGDRCRRGEHRRRSGSRCGKDARRRSMTEKREKAPDVWADSTPATVARR